MTGYVPAQTVADTYQVSPRTIHRMADRGDIPFVQVGRHRRYNLDDVAAALAPKPATTWAQSGQSLGRKRVA